MPTDVKAVQGTAISYKNTAGDHAMTFTSLANSAGRKGEYHDFGSTFPFRVRWQLRTKFASAPTAGNPLYVYWASSHDASNFDGALSSADAAMSDLNTAKKLQFIGTFFAENNTNSQIQAGEFQLPSRYGFPVVYNASGQAFTGTASDHELILVPMTDQIQ